MARTNYVLPRGLYPSVRLTFQFHLWQEALGYIVHPSVDLTNPGLKVADVATGTGLWLSELSKYVSGTAQLDGFDLSVEQFPHISCLPPNVHLQTWDATKEPPKSIVGIYDVVHIRHVGFAVENDDPSILLQNLQRLLKKGGILQWDEVVIQQMQSFRPQAELPTPYLEKIRQVFLNVKPIKWIPQLHKIFEKYKLGVVANEVYLQKQWQRHAIMENWCLVVDELSQELDKKGESGKRDELKGLISGAYEEIKRGGFYAHPMQVVVGRALA